MKDINGLIDGFQRFRTRYFGAERQLFHRLARDGQSPRVMVVACCDSRVDPAILTDCDPGDLFVVRNVANLVPPCETGGQYHGTSAALEFAVRLLKVKHIIVFGHARCGGIRALVGDVPGTAPTTQFVMSWMSIAAEARLETLNAGSVLDPEEQARDCEQAGIRISLRNLMTFQFVRQAVDSGQLAIHGWYFDLENGELLVYQPQLGKFQPVLPGSVSMAD
ncbi:MAG: carbonic anhydrase [Sulfuricaulis sp.]